MNVSFNDLLNSDVLLSCLLIIGISMLGFKLCPFSFRGLQNVSGILSGLSLSSPPSQTERAIAAFRHYQNLSLTELDRMRATYAKIGRAHKRIGYDLGYPMKLTRLEKSMKVNALVTNAIVDLTFDEGLKMNNLYYPNSEDLTKVREVLRHFVRDWSQDSQEERAVTFSPILDRLTCIQESHRRSLKVIVPGSGLGRLAWEISQLGFDTTANELSPYMNLAFRLVCSPRLTRNLLQHTIHPYAHWFSHQYNNTATFRDVKFPDALPRLSDSFRLLDGDFLKIKPVEQYDYVVTQFFIDTSLNVISTLEQIHRLLKPGGHWINLGPLLWTSGAQTALELSLAEVLSLADTLGFEVDPASRKTVDCEYTADKEAMMKWIYRAEFWIAKKRTE